tara:strand:+ start:1876 stop:2292 length:417 start_codon:yes stop_codon:yes gene_type:complete
MKDLTLPKEFKFKQSDNPEKNIKFILKLKEEGFKIVFDTEHFILKYVLSNNIFGYVIEDNYIKVLLKNIDEDTYNSYEVSEFNIDNMSVDLELKEEYKMFLDQSTLINDTISKLSKLNNKEISSDKLKIIQELNQILS